MQPLSNELLSSVIDDLPLGLCVARPSGEPVYANRAFLRILGLDRVPESHLETAQAVYGLFDRQGQPYPVEKLPIPLVLAQRRPVVVDDIVVHRSDGQKVHLRAFGASLGQDDPPRHLIVVFTDISEEVRAGEARKQVEAQLAFAVDHAPIVLWMHDRHGMITLSEGAALSALGFGPGQLVGHSAFDLYKDQPLILHNIRRVLAGESLTELTQLGSVSLQSHLAPIRDPDGEIQGLIGVATDVSESRRLEEHLFQSQKMEALGRLSGGIAHDFNNLLGVIQGFAWLNERRFKPGEPGRQDMQQILAACERGAALNRQLLALGRRQKLTLQVVDVKKLIGEVEKILRRVVGEDVELRTRMAPDLGHTKADVGQLERVLINLVVNAREAMPAGGSLTIEADNREVGDGQNAVNEAWVPPGRFVSLAVTDTGVGMDADTRARMFEPFFSTKGTGQHTGLGLATVYGIIQQSHGHIAVVSEPGRGTTIRIYLPRTDSAPAPVAAPAAARQFPPRTETVLLVEDDTLLLSLMSEVLRQAGYRVLEASNAGEALLACEQHAGEIHLLLSDVVLPRLNGLELAARVRRQHPNLRVAFMSGYADETIARYGSLEPGDILMEKPIAPEALLARLRDLLDARPDTAT